MRALLLMLALLVGGCAMGPRSTVPRQSPNAALPPEVDDPLLAVAMYEERIAALEVGVAIGAEASAPAADACESACAREAAICELATRICVISERNDAMQGLGERCEDATRRCGNAKALVGTSCRCE